MVTITDYVQAPKTSWFSWSSPWRQQRYILTGGPSVGKTEILKSLEKRGMAVVEEAVTYNIRKAIAKGDKEPWLQPDFTDKIIRRQCKWQKRAEQLPNKVIVCDRAHIDPVAYDIRDGKVPSAEVVKVLQNSLDCRYYETTVFIIKNLGAYEQTEIRHESLEESKEIETHLVDCYRKLGFKVVYIPPCQTDLPPGSIEEQVRSSIEMRTDMVWKKIQELTAPWWKQLWFRIYEIATQCFAKLHTKQPNP